MPGYRSPYLSLLPAIRHIVRRSSGINRNLNFHVARHQLLKALHDGVLTAIADYALGPTGWEPTNPVPGGAAENADVMCPGAHFERCDVPPAAWDDTDVDWRRSLVWISTDAGVEIYKRIQLPVHALDKIWSSGREPEVEISGGTGSTQPRKRRGPEKGSLHRYRSDDEKLFPQIEALIAENNLSVRAATVRLAHEKKIKGNGTEESVASRVAAVFRDYKRRPQNG
jgi:hypothetical protein